MILQTFQKNFRLQLPFQKDGVFWNGRTDEFNNIGYGLDFSQPFGLTSFAKTWSKRWGGYPYGGAKGFPNPHNGHDYAAIEGTPLYFPTRSFLTYSGYDPRGYGNFIFYETETIDGGKLEMVNAHLKEPCKLETNRWYDIDKSFGQVGSTGLSTGPHTHFGTRPLVLKNNAPTWLFEANRGYVDPMLFLDVEPVYDKAKLLKYMRLIKLEDSPDVYAVDKYGKAVKIVNYYTFQKGIILGMWEDDITTVSRLPEMSGYEINLIPSN